MKYFLTIDKNLGYFIMQHNPDGSVSEVFFYNPHKQTSLETVNQFVELLNRV